MTLKELRESRALTQREVAIACDVTTVTVGKWEGGKTRPQPPQIRKLAEYFNTDIPAMLDILKDTEEKS